MGRGYVRGQPVFATAFGVEGCALLAMLAESRIKLTYSTSRRDINSPRHWNFVSVCEKVWNCSRLCAQPRDRSKPWSDDTAVRYMPADPNECCNIRKVILAAQK